MNTPPDGWTDIDVQAEHAPIGVPLWPTIKPEYAPNYILRSVVVVRDEARTWVVWTYENNVVRSFALSEMVACRMREVDAAKLRPFQFPVHLTDDELNATVVLLACGLGTGVTDPSPAELELAGDVLGRLRAM